MQRTFVSHPRLVLHGLDAEQLLIHRDRENGAVFLELDERAAAPISSSAIRINLKDPATFGADARGLRRLAELATAIAAELELGASAVDDWNVPLEFPPSDPAAAAAAAAAAAELNEAAGRADLG